MRPRETYSLFPWHRECIKAAIGPFVCENCSKPALAIPKYSKCGYKETPYVGLICHAFAEQRLAISGPLAKRRR